MIILGRLKSGNKVALEKYALNITKKGKIIEDSSDALITTHNLNELHQFFLDNKIPARISNYSGTGACNYAYYQALYLNRVSFNSSIKIAFIHVPPRNENIKQFIISNIDKIFDI